MYNSSDISNHPLFWFMAWGYSFSYKSKCCLKIGCPIDLLIYWFPMIWWAVSDSNCRNLGFPIFPIGLDKAGWELHKKMWARSAYRLLWTTRLYYIIYYIRIFLLLYIQYHYNQNMCVSTAALSIQFDCFQVQHQNRQIGGSLAAAADKKL